MAWLKWHIESSADPKFRVIAKHAKVKISEALAIWLMILEYAFEHSGSVAGINMEIIEAVLQIRLEKIEAVFSSMRELGMLSEALVINWDKRQAGLESGVKREKGAMSNAERQRRHREKSQGENNDRNESVTEISLRNVTCNEGVTERNESVTKSNGAIKEKIKIKNKEEDIKNTYCSELDCASSEQEQELPAKRASPTHEKSKSEIAKPPDGSPLFISLPLLGNGHYDVTESMIGQLQELYPAVDVQQQLRNMRGWIEGNPKKMKKNGAKFVHGWLMRRQERGGDLKSTPQSHAMSWQEREQDAFERAIAEAKLRDAARARGEAV